METKHDDERDPIDETTDEDDGDPKPLDPEDADKAGFFGGSGGPAATIYGEDDDADEHGERLTHGPEKSL